MVYVSPPIKSIQCKSCNVKYKISIIKGDDKIKKTEVITIRTTPENKEKIEKIAKEKEWSISKTIEKIIIQELKRAGGTAP